MSSPEIRPKHLSLGAFTLHPEVGRLRLPGWERGPAGKGPHGPGFPVCRLAASLLSAKKQKGVQESVTQAAHHAGHPVASCTIRTMKCNTNTVFYGPCGKTGALPDTGHKNEYFKVGEIQKSICFEQEMISFPKAVLPGDVKEEKLFPSLNCT